MSQKKNKKRNPQKMSQNPGQLQQTAKYKRFDPLPRNLLWIDLIFLCACMWMENEGVISKEISSVCTIIGAILLFVALGMQFGPKKKAIDKKNKL